MNTLYAIALLAVLGGLFGLALVYAAKVFYVQTDEREERIGEVLPGVNCGGCGFSGCGSCAEAIVSGRASVNACVPGGSSTAAKVAEIMGVQAETRELKVAFVRCAGSCKGEKYDYEGIKDCSAAVSMGNANGFSLCASACLGLGSCAEACRFGAMKMVNGVAQADPGLCTGCGECAAACPKKLIDMIPYGRAAVIPCASTDKGGITGKLCGSGCIGCGLCLKSCEQNAISVKDNHAVIDYSRCVDCGLCAENCPRGLIRLDTRFVK